MLFHHFRTKWDKNGSDSAACLLNRSILSQLIIHHFYFGPCPRSRHCPAPPAFVVPSVSVPIPFRNPHTVLTGIDRHLTSTTILLFAPPGVQARIKEVEPRALFVHCTAHRLNLAVQETLEAVREVYDSLHEVAKLVTFYKDSPKRQVALEDAGAQSTLRPLCPTRWTCREGCLASIVANYPALVDSLQSIADDRATRPPVASTASGFARLLTEFRFFFGLRLAQHVLRLTTPAMRSVQGQTQSLSDNLGLVETLQAAVTGQRNRFEEFWLSTVQQAEELGVDEPKSARQSRPPRRLDDGAPPAHPATPRHAYKRVYYETLDRLLTALRSRYSRGDHQLLVETEKALVTGEPTAIARSAAFFGLDPDRTSLHVQMCRDVCRQRGKELNSLADIVSALQDASLRGILPDCVALVKLLLTVPATSCTAERSFSILRRLKTWLRSTISQERLSQGALLTSYPDKLSALEMENEMREFVSQTPQRMNAFGKW